MSLPVILFTGFLGAGKTTLVNRLISDSHGRRIAAIVNDFGAINIDAELIAARSDTVIGLKNGCICCSLQGDFLRAARTVIAAEPRPDIIVVEASGVAEPSGILAVIRDPALWHVIAMESVICVVDAEDLATNPGRMDDPLWKAQLAAADEVFMSKTLGLEAEALAALSARLGVMSRRAVFDADRAPLPLALLLSHMPPRAAQAGSGSGQVTLHDDRFGSLEWHSAGPIPKARFEAALAQVGGRLLRAKGIVTFVEYPGRSFLLQLVGRRATLTPHAAGEPGCRLVLIAERAQLDPERLKPILDAMAA